MVSGRGVECPSGLNSPRHEERRTWKEEREMRENGVPQAASTMDQVLNQTTILDIKVIRH